VAARGALPGLHVIAGADSYLAEEALEALTAAAVGDAGRADSVQVFRGDESTWSQVVGVARTGSLFASRRAVVVRNADALKGDGEEMVGYLEDPAHDVSLILLTVKPDKRKTVWKRLMEGASVVPAEPLKGRALRTRVQASLRQRHLALRDDGLEELLERVGQDLRRLMGELEKLEAFDSAAPLSAEDVAKVLGRGLAPPLYRLGDAFAARRGPETLDVLHALLEEGEVPLKILGTFHRSLRQVRGALALRGGRAAREELVSRLGVLPFKVGDVLEASRRWSEADLRQAFVALDRADRRMKSGSEARTALAAAVAEACAGEGLKSAIPPGR
jgi:DNA polymerase III subunit delta